MRKNRAGRLKNGFSMMILDDDSNITEALKSYFEASGYEVDTSNSPLEALEQMKKKTYDILLLDFIMAPICGDEVVARLRQFDERIYVILLTGHKEIAPPLNTIRELDIQGYFEKSERFDQLELLVESCVKSIRQMKTVYRYKDGLSKILKAVPKLHNYRPMEETAEKMLQELLELTQRKEGFLWLKPRNILKDIPVEELLQDIFSGAGEFKKGFTDFLMEDYPELEVPIQTSLVKKEIYKHNDMILIPLNCGKDLPLGVFGVRGGIEEDKQGSELLAVFAEQVSTALHNTILHTLLNANNQKLSAAYEQMRENYMQTIEAMRLLVDAKDIYTRGHSDRVSYFAEKLAQALKKEDNFIECVKTAGLLHDVGKIGVSDEILCKNGKLTDDEFKKIKKHPKLGAQILNCMTMFDNLAEIVCAHHERYDGKGYPYGLKGENIPLEARIIAVADAVDAMMSDRHYRKKLSKDECIGQLEEGKGTQFDAKVVEVMLELLKDYDTMQKDLKWTY